MAYCILQVTQELRLFTDTHYCNLGKKCTIEHKDLIIMQQILTCKSLSYRRKFKPNDFIFGSFWQVYQRKPKLSFLSLSEELEILFISQCPRQTRLHLMMKLATNQVPIESNLPQHSGILMMMSIDTRWKQKCKTSFYKKHSVIAW